MQSRGPRKWTGSETSAALPARGFLWTCRRQRSWPGSRRRRDTTTHRGKDGSSAAERKRNERVEFCSTHVLQRIEKSHGQHSCAGARGRMGDQLEGLLERSRRRAHRFLVVVFLLWTEGSTGHWDADHGTGDGRSALFLCGCRALIHSFIHSSSHGIKLAEEIEFKMHSDGSYT